MKTRKELIHAYKEQKFRVGVFQIRNTVNHKIYVEASTDLASIWNRHKFQLDNGLHPNATLQKEYRQFGAQHFVYEILSEIQQDDPAKDYRKEARQLEAMFKEELQPFGERGYH